MQYKIIFTDIDGTLLNQDRALSKKTIDTVKAVREKLPFILISARMPSAMRYLQEELEINSLPIICYNGGLILVNDQPISSTEIPLNIIKDLTNFNNSINSHISLYHHDEWYVPEYDFWAKREENNTRVTPEVMPHTQVIEKWQKDNKGAHKIMAMGTEEQIDAIRDYLQANFSEHLNLYRSKSTYLEIAHKDISKFRAIKILLENHYKYSTEETIAFGDNYNDVEMIDGVGYGVAVANARQEVLNVANLVTDAGINDGVANTLIKILKI